MEITSVLFLIEEFFFKCFCMNCCLVCFELWNISLFLYRWSWSTNRGIFLQFSIWIHFILPKWNCYFIKEILFFFLTRCLQHTWFRNRVNNGINSLYLGISFLRHVLTHLDSKFVCWSVHKFVCLFFTWFCFIWLSCIWQLK